MSQSWLRIVIEITGCKHHKCLNSGISQSRKVDCGCTGGRTWKCSVVRPKFNFQNSNGSNQISQTPFVKLFTFTWKQRGFGRCEDLHHFSIHPDRKHYKKCFKWQAQDSFPTFLFVGIEFQLPNQIKARKQSFILFSSVEHSKARNDAKLHFHYTKSERKRREILFNILWVPFMLAAVDQYHQSSPNSLKLCKWMRNVFASAVICFAGPTKGWYNAVFLFRLHYLFNFLSSLLPSPGISSAGQCYSTS